MYRVHEGADSKRQLTQPAAWAGEADIGVVEGEIVARPLSVLLRALDRRQPRDVDS
jgi:hypothetical protein